MSFIQCKDQDEAERKVKTGAFVSHDFRLYDSIEFWDDACVIEFDAETVRKLLDFQCYLEMINSGHHECPFTQILDDAKELNKSFRAAMKAIKFKPITKKEKPNA